VTKKKPVTKSKKAEPRVTEPITPNFNWVEEKRKPTISRTYGAKIVRVGRKWTVEFGQLGKDTFGIHGSAKEAKAAFEGWLSVPIKHYIPRFVLLYIVAAANCIQYEHAHGKPDTSREDIGVLIYKICYDVVRTNKLKEMCGDF